MSFYVIFFITMIKPQPRTILISTITPVLFKQLHLKYAETLSCPCSRVNVQYKAFVFNTTRFHPICSSVFVSRQWIEALYQPNASMFGTLDFRTTASSQVSQNLFFKKFYSSLERSSMKKK